jgi:hypothetical protein
MELTRLVIGSWNRFLSRNLSIQPDLVGAMHEFQFEDHKITISLPTSRHLPTEPSRGEFLRFNRYREVDGKKIPLQLWVESVEVVVSIKDEVELPVEILSRPPNQDELVSKSQQEKLDNLASVHGGIADRAFDLWIRTLRWKSDNSSIGRPEISGHESGWSTYLVAQPNGEEIWIAPVTFTLTGAKMVTLENWEAVGTSLRAGRTPPVFVDVIMDATEHLKLGDLQRATVEMAMGCEAFLRTLVAESLPSGLQASIINYVDDANIRPVLEKFMPDILSAIEYDNMKKIIKKLHELFDSRNTIMHKGQAATLTKGGCEAFLIAAKKLLSLRS